MNLTAEFWYWFFIGLILFNYIFSNILELINSKNWKTYIPDEVKDFYDEKKYNKAREYKIETGRISFFSGTLSFLISFGLIWFKGYGYISNYIDLNFDSAFIKTSVFFLFFYLINFIISIPFSYYSTFYIEEKYGFNKTTIKTFFLDKIKSIGLSLLIGGTLLFLAMFVLDLFEKGYWIYLWMGLSAFVIFLNMFYAQLIVPIFNKLTPLDNGLLREKIEKYADKVGYSLKNIFVIDGSKRSTKANAFFSGLGPKKTIALYDTLIEKHSDEELVAVLAHEVGHFKKKHILLTLIISIIQLGLMSYLFEVCMSYINIAEALGSSQMNFHVGVIAFSFVFSPIGLIIGIFLNILSRKNEFEADDYAKTTYDGNALQLALKKLSVDTLSNLYPHPLYVFVHYSHPPLIKRLINLKS
ncbi:MAG: peptidase M48 [Flavobacteriaceae bacterium]|nr:peptidase M48 [Flavobacteriaceae bacterium]|tara:strand:- start:3180 stop:4418 length:1239 start_codon:yes stop_codon:yes gene_type:complete